MGIVVNGRRRVMVGMKEDGPCEVVVTEKMLTSRRKTLC